MNNKDKMFDEAIEGCRNIRSRLTRKQKLNKEIKEACKPDLNQLEEITLNEEIRVNYNFTLSRITRVNLKLVADANDRSMSNMIEKLVSDEVEKLKQQ